MFLFVNENSGILFLGLEYIPVVIVNEILNFALSITRILEVTLER